MCVCEGEREQGRLTDLSDLKSETLNLICQHSGEKICYLSTEGIKDRETKREREIEIGK